MFIRRTTAQPWVRIKIPGGLRSSSTGNIPQEKTLGFTPVTVLRFSRQSVIQYKLIYCSQSATSSDFDWCNKITHDEDDLPSMKCDIKHQVVEFASAVSARTDSKWKPILRTPHPDPLDHVVLDLVYTVS